MTTAAITDGDADAVTAEGTPMPDLPTDLPGALRWIAEHEGRTLAWREAQLDWNNRYYTQNEALRARIGSLERRMAYWSGAAAAIGGIIGTFLGKLAQ